MKKIAALTTVRNGGAFVEKWISHYGAALGLENLTVVVDGFDQDVSMLPPAVQVIQQDYVPLSRTKGDKQRARRASRIAADLLTRYDMVIGTDVDEFILPDPAIATDLRAYLSDCTCDGSLAVMGIDLVPHPLGETRLDWSQPFLGQRQYGVISDRYTKASILTQPLQWGSGFHRVRGQRSVIDPALFLFHAGSIDQTEMDRRQADPDRRATGWANHQRRRDMAAQALEGGRPIPGDARFDSARAQLSRPRSLLAWNKPRPLAADAAIRIPDRFFGLL